MNNNNQQLEKNWKDTQENLANQSGLSVVVMDGAEMVSASNNNSICELLYASPEFSPRCANYCGKAFEQANAEAKTISVICHAGLHFNAVPLKSKENQQLVVITGRTFLKAEDYRKATARAIDGDWQNFPPTKLFQNVLLSSSDTEISKVSKSLEKLSDEEKELIFQFKKKRIDENEYKKIIILDGEI